MEKRKPRVPIKLTVTKNKKITPNMHRITLHGSDIQHYPEIHSTGYIKLLFDFDGTPISFPPVSLDDAQMRTYTIRHLDRETQTIDIDMALHGGDYATGPASKWAQTTRVGDTIMVGGPGQSKELAENYDWVLFVGDMTSLPAISTYLEKLDSDTKGHAVIRITSQDDKQDLKKPEGITLSWLSDENTTLATKVRDLSWLSGEVAAWVACEFSEMRELRQLLRKEKALAHEALYISSYWRKGRSEDQHKIDKRRDMERFAAGEYRR